MKKIISMFLVICMLFNINCESESVKCASNCDKKICSTFVGDGYEVLYEINSIWDKGYIANVHITNTGKEDIENWELSYQSTDQYTNIWNASIDYRSAKYYNIKNAGHNQNIKPGQTVSFGFQASYNGKTADIPQKYSLLGEHLVVNKKDCIPKFEIVNSWKDGCIMNVTLYNNSDKNIEDWSINCQFDYRVSNIWRATVSNTEGNNYTFKNCEYNSVIRPGETETFGMQISFEENAELIIPYNVVMKQYRKDDFYMDFDKNWNYTMIRSDDTKVKEAIQKNKNTIKIGIIDSGIDYSSNIKVQESENFVEDFSEKNPIFSDLSGHGTAVAGILASDPSQNEDNYEFDNKYLKQLTTEKVSGINPYVQLYSAEVLDEDNTTTVEQLVNGIEWAIEKEVNIINISCGLEKNSNKLYNAVKKAYDKGILIIASAGVGEKVQYPAKYDEVMAVGAVKCDGTLMKDSPVGDEIEVVAPGEDVTTYGPFGILTNESGTSISAAHVSALATILWQQDKTKSAQFIRELIKETANSLGSKNEFGEGLIDCAYALEQYDNFSQKYVDKKFVKIEVNDNDNTLLLYDDSEVKGFWRGEKHKNIITKDIKKLKRGATWPDAKVSKVAGMIKNPKFHGYFKQNYISAYIYMTKVASNMYSKGKFLKTDSAFEKKVKKTAQIGFEKYKITSKQDKAAFIYGMALHTAADIFAHSTTGVSGQNQDTLKKKSVKKLAKKWGTLKHGPKNKKTGKYNPKKNMADSVKCVPNRYQKGAKRVCNAIINQAVIKHKVANKKAFKQVGYYKSLASAKKLTSKKKKKLFLINSYGIYNLNTYLKYGSNKKLESVVKNLTNSNVKKVVNEWK